MFVTFLFHNIIFLNWNRCFIEKQKVFIAKSLMILFERKSLENEIEPSKK
jgi:predicted nucleic acid binding AN1-type Zn finger protein